MKAACDTSQLVIERLQQSIAVKQAILADHDLLDLVNQVAEVCVRALEAGRKMILLGNGGSAADSQHIAAELVGRYLRGRRALPAIALTTNSSNITAIGNDYSYQEVFSRQIEALGVPGDVLVAISTSGKSENVIRAVRAAKRKGLATIGLSGQSGGALREETEYCLCVPSSDTPRIQEAHIWLGHIVCEIIEQHFTDDRDIA